MLGAFVVLPAPAAATLPPTGPFTLGAYGRCTPSDPNSPMQYFGELGGDMLPPVNAPDREQAPQYFASIIAHTGGCWASLYRAGIELWGFFPDGTPLEAWRIRSSLAFYISPDTSGVANTQMQILADVLSTAPYGLGVIPAELVRIAAQNPGPISDDGTKVTIQTDSLYYPGNERGIQVAFQLKVDPSRMVGGEFGGGYQIYAKYYAVWGQTNACGKLNCPVMTGLTYTDAVPLYCYLKCNPPQTNHAQFISQTMPTSLYTGQSASVTVTMKNDGQTTWWPYDRGSYAPEYCADCSSLYRLVSISPASWGPSLGDLPRAVFSGDTIAFTFTVTAPLQPGTYDWQWQMVQEVNPGTRVVEWIAAPSPYFPVSVIGASTIAGNVGKSSGGALSGASVRITSPSGATSTATTDTNGHYASTVFELGTYSLTASQCGYISQTKSVAVNAWNTLSSVDFTLAPYTGYGNIAPIYVTLGGTARQGAAVTVTNCNGATVYSATTDSGGMVPGVANLAGGTYTVTVSWTDWSTCTGDPGQVHWIYKGTAALAIPPNVSPTVALIADHSARCPI
jgi:hypothetical protein